MKVLALIVISCVSMSVVFAADLKVGDKCTTSAGTAGTVVKKYTEQGEEVGLTCKETTATIIARNPALSADTRAKRIFDRWGKPLKKTDCATAGGVWAGPDGTGSCTRPQKK